MLRVSLSGVLRVVLVVFQGWLRNSVILPDSNLPATLPTSIA